MKNHFGMEAHPSDELIHWSDRTDTKEGKQRIKKIRAAWDLLNSKPELKAAFHVLKDAYRDKAGSDQGEIEAGANL